MSEEKELILVHNLDNLWNYLSGAHSVCDHENSSATFHQACHMVKELISMINKKDQ